VRARVRARVRVRVTCAHVLQPKVFKRRQAQAKAKAAPARAGSRLGGQPSSGRPMGTSGIPQTGSSALSYVAPVSVRPGVETMIEDLKPPHSSINVNRTNGCFVVMYKGKYVTSLSWWQRNSTSETLKLALREAWAVHLKAYGGTMPAATNRQINAVDISSYNITR